MHLYKPYVKPTLDYVFATLFLLAGWPFLVVLYIVNRLVFGTGFYIQERIGQNEVPFYCLKFRSMRVEGDESSIPGWGRFLRYSSIDELPQLINILRGEMSFIGPRPLLPEYLAHYTLDQKKRHHVKPGITGLAQVNGRNLISWEESLKLDVAYAETVSFMLDFKIFVKTIPQVFKFGQVQQSEKTSRTAFNQDKR